MSARALWLNGRCSEQKEEVQAQPKQLEAPGGEGQDRGTVWQEQVETGRMHP